MALIQSLLPSDKYSKKCPYSMNPIGICVHNTANDAPAKNEVSYMKSNNNSTSFHVAVDDKDVAAFKKMQELGVELEIKRVPDIASEPTDKLFK